MTCKIFLPPLDTRWRLTADFTPPAGFELGDNAEVMTGDSWSSLWSAAMKDPGVGSPPTHGTPEYEAWDQRFDAFRDARRESYGFDRVFPSGTIIQIERYHVSRSGENQITIKVLLSPSKFLTPKKQKGLMRGAGRLYFTLDQFNQLGDVEEFTDVLG